MFVTSAISSGTFKQPSTGIYGNEYVAELRGAGTADGGSDQARQRARHRATRARAARSRYMVYAFDAATGKVRWEREAHNGLPVGGRHRKNTYASETPATDGERIYA